MHTLKSGLVAMAVSASGLLSACATTHDGGRDAPVNYGLVRQFVLPGGDGWDYLSYDTEGGRLFIARGDRVQVVDPKDGRLVGEIPGTRGVHGVAIAYDQGKGYTSNGRAGSVTVFDLKTLAVLSTIVTPAGKNPDFITYDTQSHRVLAFNGRSSNASVIDATSDTVIATIELSGKPEAAVTDSRGAVYVNIEDRNEILVLDMASRSVAKHLPLPGCDEPASLAIDPETRRLFVGCHNEVMLVVSIESGDTLAALAIGSGVDASAFDARMHLVFTSQKDGTLTIVREASDGRFEVVQNASTAKEARTMALDPSTHEVYVVSGEFDDLPPVEAGAVTRRVVRPGTFKLSVIAPR